MIDSEYSARHETRFTGTVRLLKKSDLPFLKPILEIWIRDRKTHEIIVEEVEETLKAMEDSVDIKNDRTYFVAETGDGSVIGTMGMRNPDPRLLEFARTDKPIELINAFVSNNHRKLGAGKTLVQAIIDEAKQKGYKELILDSGPRYMYSGWGAWNKIFGQPTAVAKNYYGKGANAPVWSKLL